MAQLGWVDLKYYPVDQGGKLIKEPHSMSVNLGNVITVRQTDNDVGMDQCHLQTQDGTDFTIAESYTAVINKLRAGTIW